MIPHISYRLKSKDSSKHPELYYMYTVSRHHLEDLEIEIYAQGIVHKIFILMVSEAVISDA